LKERKQLVDMVQNMTDHQDTILEHGYTGPIKESNKDAIIGTVMVSIVNKRLLYLKEFVEGLKSYGLADALKSNYDLFKPLFVANTSGQKPVGAIYVFSLVNPCYSTQGKSKRKLEDVIENFQDFLMLLEDKQVRGTLSPLDDTNKFQEADLTPAGVLGWLTGQRHRPLNGDSLVINVKCH
jgi:hypothetical protein